MLVDDTIQKILKEIQDEYNTKGINLSIEEIFNIVESQYKVAELAFKKNLEVELPYFGKFMKTYGFESGQSSLMLKEREGSMTPEEYKKAELQLKIRNKEFIKNKYAESYKKRYTLEEFKEVKDKVNLINKYDKILKD